jgi:hypothetical protein
MVIRPAVLCKFEPASAPLDRAHVLRGDVVSFGATLVARFEK